MESEDLEGFVIGRPTHSPWEEPLWLSGDGEFVFEFSRWMRKKEIDVWEEQVCRANWNS